MTASFDLSVLVCASGADVGMCGALDSVWSRAIGGGQIFHQVAVNVYIVL